MELLIESEFQSVQKEQQCSISCPGDCVVSEWTAWTNCDSRFRFWFLWFANIARYIWEPLKLSCSDSIRNRSRSILRQSSISTCAFDLMETESCVAGINCNQIKTVWTEWTSCTSQNGCNNDGSKFRFMNCYKNNQLVDPYECSSSGEELVERQTCRFECDVDCIISDWGEWSPCPPMPTCGVLQERVKPLASNVTFVICLSKVKKVTEDHSKILGIWKGIS